MRLLQQQKRHRGFWPDIDIGFAGAGLIDQIGVAAIDAQFIARRPFLALRKSSVGDAYDRADKDFSLVYWQWSFLAAPEPVPEQFINAVPANMVEFMLDTWAEVKDAFPTEVRAEYIEKFSDPDTVHAVCEEFRASATLDYQHDEADRGKRKIASSASSRARTFAPTRARVSMSGCSTFAAVLIIASRYCRKISTDGTPAHQGRGFRPVHSGMGISGGRPEGSARTD